MINRVLMVRGVSDGEILFVSLIKKSTNSLTAFEKLYQSKVLVL